MKGNTSHGFRKQYLTDESIKIFHKVKELNPNGAYVFEPDGKIMTTDSFNRRLKKLAFFIIRVIKSASTTLQLLLKETISQPSVI